jgi:hypothetical protein
MTSEHLPIEIQLFCVSPYLYWDNATKLKSRLSTKSGASPYGVDITGQSCVLMNSGELRGEIRAKREARQG